MKRGLLDSDWIPSAALAAFCGIFLFLILAGAQEPPEPATIEERMTDDLDVRFRVLGEEVWREKVHREWRR